MKILLVNPPNCGRSISSEKYGLLPTHKIFQGEPLALETLAGNLLDHEVEILDLKIPREDFIITLANFDPDIVGFTSLTCEIQTVLNLCKLVKQWKSSTIVVIGGVHVSNCIKGNFNNVDYLILGLGKQSFNELVYSIEHKDSSDIPGVLKIAGNSYISRNYSQQDLLSDLPPRYDLVDKYRKHYQILGSKIGFVASAAGCPNRCSFCSIANLTSNKYLSYGINDVIRDIKLLNNDISIIRLVDANTFGSIARARALAEAIAGEGIQKHFMVDACADAIVKHKDIFRLWKSIGLRAIVVGFEEINNEILTQWNKKNTFSIVKEAIEILHELGISIIGDFIISPEYEEKDFEYLGKFVENSKIECPVFTILTPLPGTHLYNSMERKITIKDLDYYTLTNAVIPTKLPEKEFYQLYVDYSMKFYKNITL